MIVCLQGDDKQDSSDGDHNPGAGDTGGCHLLEVYQLRNIARKYYIYLMCVPVYIIYIYIIYIYIYI